MTCEVCGIEHDESVHAAVLNVRGWLKQRLALAMRPVAISKPRDGVPPSVRDVVGLRLATLAERKRASRLGARGQRR